MRMETMVGDVDYRRSFRRACQWLACLLLLVLASPVAFAQEEEAPLRISVLNVTGAKGEDGYRTLRGILADSPQIALTEQDVLLQEARKLDLKLDSFRKADEREFNVGWFQRLIAAARIEAIVVLDVYANGTKLQLVVLGPYGNQVADVRRNIKRGRLKDEEAMDALRDVFAAVIPEVRAFRQEQSESSRREASAAEEARLKAEEEARANSLANEAIQEHLKEKGYLVRALRLEAGGVYGTRQLTLQADDPEQFRLDQNIPFLGGQFLVDWTFSVSARADSAIGARVFGSYAPFETLFGEERLPSNYIRAGLDGYYQQLLSRSTVFRLFAGAELMAVTIGPNPAYTGHRYVSGRAGAGLAYGFGDLAVMELEAGALPVLNSDNSGGYYGKAGFSVGFEGHAGLRFRLGESLSVRASYTLQRYTLSYPLDANIPPLNQLGLESTSRDMMHTVGFTLGYAP